ncbi:type-F conjugative transfer system pilin assembly thiol-disulfide isomerase TrbB [Legionella qingyii]|uniref:type-F conjugative transfer system pilin assembly thiol-disulfide isomerase TrbB n=1 Tax=Legionella qingyii TaxID=2184757 RepID=UPI001F18F550|nr:type-F conjugative transfer system pilin assembly thiol-disulfide isomerase TrbB [Legionella qingyii]
MMHARWFMTTLLATHAFMAYAGSQQWLTQMIVEHERTIQQKNRVEEPQNQNNDFFSQHGLILFYASSCPHCHQFAPVLKSWAGKNKAEVLALSIDNKPLPEFPQFLPATTEWINDAFQGAPIQYPALFVVNPKTKALYPVAFGSMTAEELDYRFEVLIPKIAAYEHKERSL